MIPTWVGVVTALSLAVIALAVIAVAASAIAAALAMRALIRMVQGFAGPAMEDVRQLIGTIRTEANGWTGTSRELRERVLLATDLAQRRLAELDALVEVVQDEVESVAVDVAGTLRTLRRGLGLLDLGRRAIGRRRGKR